MPQAEDQQPAAALTAVRILTVGDLDLTGARIPAGDLTELVGVPLEPGELAGLMAAASISTGVVFHPDNAAVNEVLWSVPDLRGLVWVDAAQAVSADEAARYLGDRNWCGVKLQPPPGGNLPADPGLWRMMELLERHQLPVLVRSGPPPFTPPSSVADLAARFPAVPVVLSHVRGGDIASIHAAIEAAAQHPNIYLEMPGIPVHAQIAEAVRPSSGGSTGQGHGQRPHQPRAGNDPARQCGPAVPAEHLNAM